MATITRDQANELVQALDLEQDDLRTDYSGRGMYGDECFGLIIDVPDLIVGVAMRDVFGEDAWDIARAARTDSMGRSTIVYFPGWKVEDEDTDDDEG